MGSDTIAASAQTALKPSKLERAPRFWRRIASKIGLLEFMGIVPPLCLVITIITALTVASNTLHTSNDYMDHSGWRTQLEQYTTDAASALATALYLQEQNAPGVNARADQAETQIKQAQAVLAQLSELTDLSTEVQRELRIALETSQELLRVQNEALTGIRDGSGKGAALYRTVASPLQVQLGTNLDKLQTAMDDAQVAYYTGQQAWIYRMLGITMIVVLVISIVTMILGGLITATLRRSSQSTRDKLQVVATGDLTVQAPQLSADELGLLAPKLNQALDSLRTAIKQSADISVEVENRSIQITSRATEISQQAQTGTKWAKSLVSSTEAISQNVHNVAAGTEEMGVSIKEISSNANNAARFAAQATEVAQSTTQTVAHLGNSSQEIGEVVETIKAIAEQTNLLALNATIEAARAGEAGKGFAVVAGEVKELAGETARATETISQRIEIIQADTAQAISAIEEISQVISEINNYQVTIASAVEEQTATTAEMSRSVSEAAAGASDIAQNVRDLASISAENSTSLDEVGQGMQAMSKVCQSLQDDISQFRYQEK